MRVFLIRHGQSQANADWNTNKEVADHAIPLSEDGHQQALAAGSFLAEWFDEHLAVRPASPDPGAAVSIPRIRLWHSPYQRTRQTAARVVERCRLDIDGPVELLGTPPSGPPSTPRARGESWFFDPDDPDDPVAHGHEHLLLAEQQFGVFDGLSDEERAREYPREQAYYEKCKAYEGKLWPKMPLGESRFEVCQRVHQAFGTFHRDAERHGIETIVVVGHGTTNRAFVQMWLHKRWEWMHQEPNPRNCSIRLIEDGIDHGYIFAGFEDPPGYKHRAKETEE